MHRTRHCTEDALSTTSLVWNLETSAMPQVAWEFLREIDAIERLVGFDYRFEERYGLDGHRSRIGRMHRYGHLVRFEEQATRWISGQKWRVERNCPSGPLGRMVFACTLTRTAGTTRVRFSLDLTPSDPKHAMAVAADARAQMHPTVAAGLETVFEEIRAQVHEDLVAERHRQETATIAALDSSSSHGTDPTTPSALTGDADPLADDRIGPAPEEATVILDLLNGARQRRFEFTLIGFCPICGVQRNDIERFSAVPAPIRCSGCEFTFNARFACQTIAQFRDIATEEEPTETPPVPATNSPADTPQIQALWPLEPGEVLNLTIDAAEGIYQIYAASGAPAIIDVRPGGPSSPIEAEIRPDGLFPCAFRVAPGPLDLRIRSLRPTRVLVAVSQRTLRADALSAGRWWSYPALIDKLPMSHRPRALSVERHEAVVLAVEGEGVSFEAYSPQSSCSDHNAHIATFSSLAEALAAAEALAPGRSVALHQGTVAILREGAHRIPTGIPIEEAGTLLRQLGRNRVVVAPQLVGTLQALGVDVISTDGVGFVRFKTISVKDDLVIPAEFDGYRVVRTLGGGPIRLAEVRDTTTQKVALAAFARPSAADHDHIQRMVTETYRLAAVRHPALLQTIARGAEGYRRPQPKSLAVPWIISALPDGDDLTQILSRGPLVTDRALAIGKALLEGVAAAHAAGHVHRGLAANLVFVAKPALGSTGETVQVAGFGLVADDPQHPILPTADVLALGLILYRAFSGRSPFDARTPKNPLLVTPLTTVAPRTPPRIATAIMTAIHDDPNRRWVNAGAMLAAWNAATD